jgi:hypothetical protein
MKHVRPTKLRPENFYLAYLPAKYYTKTEWGTGSGFVKFEEYGNVWRKMDLGMFSKTKGAFFRLYKALRTNRCGDVNWTMRDIKKFTWYELDETEVLLYIVGNQL